MPEDDQTVSIVRIAEQDHAAARADVAERVKIQWSIADATMKALLLANGGAMIALFTFVGNLMAKSPKAPLFDASSLRWSFGCFVAGLVLALLTHASAFLSQEQFLFQSTEEAWRQQRIVTARAGEDPTVKEVGHFRRGSAWYTLSFGLAVVSVALFSAGCWYALRGVLIS